MGMSGLICSRSSGAEELPAGSAGLPVPPKARSSLINGN